MWRLLNRRTKRNQVAAIALHLDAQVVITIVIRFICTYSFPSDAERCKLWVKNTNLKNLLQKSTAELHQNYRLCEKHFESSQFFNESKQRLIWNAIPTIFNDVPYPPQPITRRRMIGTPTGRKSTIANTVCAKKNGNLAGQKAAMSTSTATETTATNPMSPTGNTAISNSAKSTNSSSLGEPQIEIPNEIVELKSKLKSLRNKYSKLKRKSEIQKNKSNICKPN